VSMADERETVRTLRLVRDWIVEEGCTAGEALNALVVSGKVFSVAPVWTARRLLEKHGGAVGPALAEAVESRNWYALFYEPAA
jgi:hypothetical protein